MKKTTDKPRCCAKNVTFSYGNTVYSGTIQHIGHYGASVATRISPKIPKGEKIRMTLLFDNQENLKSAEIVWSDLMGFGAKFV